MFSGKETEITDWLVIWGLGFRVLGVRTCGVGFGIQGVGFGVLEFRFRVCRGIARRR